MPKRKSTTSPRRKVGRQDMRTDMCVIGGAGHVGLPFSLSFAHSGKRVLICDTDSGALAKIARGVLPFPEENGERYLKEALAKNRLAFTSNPADMPPRGAIIVTIGTPVDEFLNPEHKVMRECIDGLLPHLTHEHLLVLRSTVYPGTTTWLQRYLKSAGKFPKIAYCPERVVQGSGIRELAELPQIVSGTTPEALVEVKRFFHGVAPETFEMTPLEAEFAKLFNNCYRYLHFAIANEFFMIATSAGADFRRIHSGMTHGYPRAKDMPSAGFTAGPCLVKDTMQLAAFARNQFNLGHAAMRVNEGLVLFLIDRLAQRYKLKSMTVGLLGMAFKPNSDDTRASLSYKLKNELAVQAKRVLCTDPYVKTDPDLRPLADVLEQSDVLILCVPHAAYRKLDAKGTPIVDIWNLLGAPNILL